MSRFRLKENHPLRQKIEKVFELMYELELSFDRDLNHDLVVMDQKTGASCYVKGLGGSGDWVTLPPTFEYKFTTIEE